MNGYRFLSYLLLVAIAVLAVALAHMLAVLTGGAALTPEVRRGLVVLVLVLLLALLILLFLLCLARAKERLAAEKRLYRRAHGADANDRTRAEEELARRETALRSICDVLVRRKFPRPCVQLPVPVTRRPDPCIYSQFYLMANGQPVTWDNPNVEILLGGVPQDTYNLQPSTAYQVRVGIENASPFFDSIATQVQVNLLTFGMGAPSPSPITTFVKDVPAATSFPGVPEVFAWTSPAPPGHYCIQVLISHPDDVNTGNNEGWNNTVIRGAQPGEALRLVVPVWNARRDAREGARGEDGRRFSQVEVALDSYVLDPTLAGAGDLDALFAPRAAMWDARVSPSRLSIPPGSEKAGEVEFTVTVPAAAPPGTRATFNLSATAGGWPLGGVTIHLEVQ